MSTTQPDPTTLSDEEIRAAVRDRYAASASTVLADLGGSSCCSPVDSDAITRDLYDADQAGEVPQAALAASLGCGNPTALAALEPGQTVLDLGSGGGIDVLLSARRVGPTGKAYGLDMTPEMLELARRNQAEAGVENAEFLHGTIEDVPLPDATVEPALRRVAALKRRFAQPLSEAADAATAGPPYPEHLALATRLSRTV